MYRLKLKIDMLISIFYLLKNNFQDTAATTRLHSVACELQRSKNYATQKTI